MKLHRSLVSAVTLVAVAIAIALWAPSATATSGNVSPPPMFGASDESIDELAQEINRLADHTVTARMDYVSMLFVFMLATFIGIGVIRRVSRLLHTPLMSLTNAISAIAVVGAIIVAGDAHSPWGIRLLGSIALFASMTNIISGFMITDRMLKMFKTGPKAGQPARPTGNGATVGPATTDSGVKS